MRRLVLACLLVLALGSCGGSPTPIEPTGNAPSASSKAAETTRTTAKPPTLPAAAKTNDATGAANFVVYWMKVSDYASLTGDTRRLRDVSSRDCSGCYRYIDLYEETYDAGGWIRGGTNTLENVSVEAAAATYLVRAQISSAPGWFKRSRQAASQPTPSERLQVSFAVSRPSGEWSMTQIGLEP